jgi:hypothetical protein
MRRTVGRRSKIFSAMFNLQNTSLRKLRTKTPIPPHREYTAVRCELALLAGGALNARFFAPKKCLGDVRRNPLQSISGPHGEWFSVALWIARSSFLEPRRKLDTEY